MTKMEIFFFTLMSTVALMLIGARVTHTEQPYLICESKCGSFYLWEYEYIGDEVISARTGAVFDADSCEKK